MELSHNQYALPDLYLSSVSSSNESTHVPPTSIFLLSIAYHFKIIPIFSMEISQARHDAAEELLNSLEIVLAEVSHRTVLYCTVLY